MAETETRAWKVSAVEETESMNLMVVDETERELKIAFEMDAHHDEVEDDGRSDCGLVVSW